jgi:hypothetical protein
VLSIELVCCLIILVAGDELLSDSGTTRSRMVSFGRSRARYVSLSLFLQIVLAGMLDWCNRGSRILLTPMGLFNATN